MQFKSFDIRKSLLFLLMACVLTGCMTPKPTDPEALKAYEELNDPLEPYNRAATDFNFFLNTYLFRPFDKIYRFILPEPVRTGISNFADNLKQHYIFVNALLQGDFDDSAQTFGRFFTNTTLGIGGLFDVATYFEIKAPKKDFGQTLYKWGVTNDGPYLVLPVIGPSNARDTIGMGIGFFIDPLDWALPKAKDHLLWYRYGIQLVDSADKATDLLWNIEQTSIDPYVTLRTYYRQNRNKFLRGEEAAKESYNFSFDDDDDFEDVEEYELE